MTALAWIYILFLYRSLLQLTLFECHYSLIIQPESVLFLGKKYNSIKYEIWFLCQSMLLQGELRFWKRVTKVLFLPCKKGQKIYDFKQLFSKSEFNDSYAQISSSHRDAVDLIFWAVLRAFSTFNSTTLCQHSNIFIRRNQRQI